MKALFLCVSICVSSLILQSATFSVSSVSELQTALTSAQSNGESDIINIADGTYNLSTSLQYYTTENYSLSIQANSAATCILDGGNSIEILHLETTLANADISISGICFRRGNSTYGGTGINIESSTVHIRNCSFIDNNAVDFGGGLSVYTNTGSIIIDSCIFTSNTATSNDAGGLYAGCNNGSITLSNSNFTDNSALGDDAGGCMLYSDNAGSVSMHHNTFSNNSAAEDAGGAMVYLLGINSSADIYNNYFENNYAYLGGGGCWIRLPAGGNVSYYNNTHLLNKTAIGAGAGVLIELQISGDLNLNNNSFVLDSAGIQNGIVSDGGGVWIEHQTGNINIQQNDFFHNYAYNNGGALFLYTESGSVDFHHNRISNNACGNVGGGFSFAGTNSSLNAFNNSYYGNNADGSGGSEYLYLDNLAAITNIYNNIYYNNSPDNFDYSGAATVNITYSLIEGSASQSYFGTGCIDSNPIFNDPINNDLLLCWANYPINDLSKSPCIDSGDPASPNDPDSSRADMGAYFFGAFLNVENITSMTFVSIYPNPANNAVSIEIDKMEEGKTVQFTLYDIRGSLLLHKSFVGVNKTILLDNISNGLYFYSVEVNGIIVKQDKLIVLK